MAICSFHVMCAFQSEPTLFSCLNVKELFAENRRDIWNLSDCNRTRTHNYLVSKRTRNHLAKLTQMIECLFTNQVVVGSCPVAVILILSCCNIRFFRSYWYWSSVTVLLVDVTCSPRYLKFRFSFFLSKCCS